MTFMITPSEVQSGHIGGIPLVLSFGTAVNPNTPAIDLALGAGIHHFDDEIGPVSSL
jgi:hypothetical protein